VSEMVSHPRAISANGRPEPKWEARAPNPLSSTIPLFQRGVLKGRGVLPSFRGVTAIAVGVFSSLSVEWKILVKPR